MPETNIILYVNYISRKMAMSWKDVYDILLD